MYALSEYSVPGSSVMADSIKQTHDGEVMSAYPFNRLKHEFERQERTNSKREEAKKEIHMRSYLF
jgi:hypothetical protein